MSDLNLDPSSLWSSLDELATKDPEQYMKFVESHINNIKKNAQNYMGDEENDDDENPISRVKTKKKREFSSDGENDIENDNDNDIVKNPSSWFTPSPQFIISFPLSLSSSSSFLYVHFCSSPSVPSMVNAHSLQQTHHNEGEDDVSIPFSLSNIRQYSPPPPSSSLSSSPSVCIDAAFHPMVFPSVVPSSPLFLQILQEIISEIQTQSDVSLSSSPFSLLSHHSSSPSSTSPSSSIPHSLLSSLSSLSIPSLRIIDLPSPSHCIDGPPLTMMTEDAKLRISHRMNERQKRKMEKMKNENKIKIPKREMENEENQNSKITKIQIPSSSLQSPSFSSPIIISSSSNGQSSTSPISPSSFPIPLASSSSSSSSLPSNPPHSPSPPLCLCPPEELSFKLSPSHFIYYKQMESFVSMENENDVMMVDISFPSSELNSDANGNTNNKTHHLHHHDIQSVTSSLLSYMNNDVDEDEHENHTSSASPSSSSSLPLSLDIVLSINSLCVVSENYHLHVNLSRHVDVNRSRSTWRKDKNRLRIVAYCKD